MIAAQPAAKLPAFAAIATMHGVSALGQLRPTPTPGALMSKPRVHLRLDAGLLALLEASAREQATSKTAVLEEALGPYC